MQDFVLKMYKKFRGWRPPDPRGGRADICSHPPPCPPARCWCPSACSRLATALVTVTHFICTLSPKIFILNLHLLLLQHSVATTTHCDLDITVCCYRSMLLCRRCWRRSWKAMHWAKKCWLISGPWIQQRETFWLMFWQTTWLFSMEGDYRSCLIIFPLPEFPESV